MIHYPALAAAAFALLATGPLAAQSPWSWQGTLAAGQTIEVSGFSGTVRAVPARGQQARVVATTSGRRHDPDAVHVVAIEHDGGVKICAVPYGARTAGDCEGGNYDNGGRRGREQRSVRVDFEVQVPAGVHFTGSSLSGDIRATELTGDVRASTLSGDVFITTAGAAQATTLSGDIDVTMGRTDRNVLSFSTLSGRIVVRHTGDLDADVRFSTLSGTLESDFPITLSRGGGRRGLEGTIGGGGAQLRFSSLSGNVRLLRL